MLFSDVFIFNYPITVLPKGKEIPISDIERTYIRIKESLVYDVSFECMERGKNINAPYISESLALFAFLLFVRGLPLTDAIIDAPSGPVEIFNTGEGEENVSYCEIEITRS